MCELFVGYLLACGVRAAEQTPRVVVLFAMVITITVYYDIG